MELVIGTQHSMKQQELKDLLRCFPNIRPCSLSSLLDRPPQVIFTADSVQTAERLASTLARQLNTSVLVDLSMLTIPALEQGIEEDPLEQWEEERQNHPKRVRVLELTQELSGIRRAAYLQCTLALASRTGSLKSVSAITEGILVEEERGSHGFGFDSIFCKHDYEKTFGELPLNIKNRISHRRKAFDLLRIHLERMMTVALA